MSEDIVIDHYNGNRIIRPFVNATFKYDFDFRKKGENVWRYLDSSDEIHHFKFNVDAVLSKGHEFRILNSITGEVVIRGGN